MQRDIADVPPTPVEFGDLVKWNTELQFLCDTPDCVKVIDLGGRVRFISDIGRQLLQLDSTVDVIGQEWAGFWPEASQSVVKTAVAEALAGKTARFDGFCPTSKGEPKWWDVVVRRVPGKADGCDYMIAVSRDMTRHKQLEDSLRTSEQRFRALADNMAQLAWMADGNVDVFWYNQRWYDYTGATPEQMKGKGWRSVHHPDHIERVETKIKASFDAGTIWEDVFPLRAADGSYRWFLSRAMPVRDENGSVVLWCGTNTDVTEQRTNSQRLRQLVRILELSHEAILVWDPDPDVGILMWNHGCEELYGYSKQEALGRSTHDLLHSRHPIPTDLFMSTLLRDGSWTGEIKHTTRDGKEVWVDSRHEVMRVGGRTVILETNRDITERRIADEVSDLLVAELNHRVKNTLAIVQSIVKQSSRSAVDVRQFVRSFKDRLQSLSTAHNVLTDGNWAGAWLRELVVSQIAVSDGSLRHIDIEGEDVFLPAQIALQLTLLIHELATNALKHGALSVPDGRVHISWSTQAGETATGKQLMLVWKESGGPKVVAPTQRGFGTTLIERSGRLPHFKTELAFEPDGLECRINAVLPEENIDASRMFNPRRAGPSSAARAKRQQGAIVPLRKVLVLTSDRLDQMRLDDALVDANYNPITQTNSSEEALEIARSDIAAAVVDLDMSPASTRDVLHMLRARGVPLVLLAEKPDKVAALAGAETVLRKPVAPKAVMAALALAKAPRHRDLEKPLGD